MKHFRPRAFLSLASDQQLNLVLVVLSLLAAAAAELMGAHIGPPLDR